MKNGSKEPEKNVEVEVNCGANPNPVTLLAAEGTDPRYLHGIHTYITKICPGCTNHTLASMAQQDAELGFSQYDAAGIKEDREQFLVQAIFDERIPLGHTDIKKYPNARNVVGSCSSIGAK